jgi:hypothetical protein
VLHLLWVGESHTLKLPCASINFDSAGIFL